MKKTVHDYILLTGLCLATGYVLYREYGRPLIVHAAEPSAPASAAVPGADPEKAVDVSFSTRERQVFRDYVRTRIENKPGRNLPPGLAKKADRGKNLPVGWQDKLVQGEFLPEEIYRECHSVPREMLVLLPPQPLGTFLIAIDGKILRLARSNRTILDVFDVQQSGS